MEKGKQVWFDSDMREVEEEEGGFGSDGCRTRVLRNAQELFAKCSPLELTLTKKQSLVNFFETRPYQAQEAFSSCQVSNERSSRARDNLVAKPSAEKLKATNFRISSIRIGAWQRNSENEGDLIAKFYYAKRKIVWEVLDEKVLDGNNVKLKSKIEILWSNITAIRAILPDDQPGILQIELDKPPVFFRENEPEPKKHTNWQSEKPFDFTNGHAHIWRIHCVTFPPKVVDNHFNNLLQNDPRLLKLSQQPFPSQLSPYFQSAMIMSSFNGFEPSIIQQYQRLTNAGFGLPVIQQYHPRMAMSTIRQPPNPVMGFQRNYQLCPLSSSSSVFAPQIPASQVCFTGQPNGPSTFDGASLHGQLMDLMLHTTDINSNSNDPNHQVMPDNNCADNMQQPNNILEGSNDWTTIETNAADYSMLPSASPIDSDDDLLLYRYIS